MATIKNITNGPKGIHTTLGIVVLEAGEIIDLDDVDFEMTDGEIASSAKTGWFEGLPDSKAKPADTDETDVDRMTVEQLKAYLTAHGVDFDASAKKDDLLKLAKGG